MRIPVIFLILLLLGCVEVEYEEYEKMREPAVSGLFYPNESGELARVVDFYLEMAEKEEINGSLVGLIVPHAGYAYSGGVAAHAYKLVEKDFRRVIILAPSHHSYFHGASYPDYTHYKTPLGVIPVEKIEVEKKLVSVPEAHIKEHSIEVQLPFLQRVLEEFQIVPILTGEVSYLELADFLLPLLDEQTLLIASSDLSHYHSWEEALKLDSICLDAFESIDLAKMGGCEACGKIPLLTILEIARRLNLESKVLEYKNSGDITGDKRRVVGYAAVAFYIPELSEEQKKFLLRVARETLEAYYKNESYEVKTDDPMLVRKQGAFVTLKKDGLRGCIGSIIPVRPLYQDVQQNALNAALRDRRFPPVQAGELSEIEIEISVLSIPTLIYSEGEERKKEVKVGRDGLIIVRGRNQGVLLPQVPVENGWNENEFLKQTCRKAWLPSDCWKEEETKVYKFSADVFSESELGIR
jgi:hypothetical protein